MASELDAGLPGLARERVVRAGLWVIAGTLAAMLAWAELAPVSGAVVAAGEVRVSGERKTVQHLEGGIVAELKVADGDVVQAGQVLLVLGDARVDASVDALQNEIVAERLTLARLESEKRELPALALPQDLTAQAASPRYSSLIEGEQRLFQTRRNNLREQLSLLEAQAGEAEREAGEVQRQVEADQRAVAALREQLQASEKLAEQKFIQHTRLLELRSNLAVREADMAEHQAMLSRTRQNIGDFRLRRTQVRAEFVQRATDEAQLSGRKLLDLQARLRPAQDSQRRKEVVAPVAGRAVNLQVHTVGGVVRPGEPIVDIVPEAGALIVEVRVSPQDVEEVHAGQPAEVRLSAYNARTTPLMPGRVIYVSADRLVDSARGMPYYVVHVQLDRKPVERVEPGMPVEAFLRTRERGMLDYLLDPVINVTRRSMRES
ncbi:Putative proteases secretion protein prtE [Methyloversatilis universalis FAM5]|uniref:Membrane fusion protein (MFP) family protein n=1 Tax=Methyloversatilis universalis (strain ATCC BAA-1314 / DSM 25237 / JCM 13912 / CCUG 52030 / FAM5) TaxID=1000565 RepID=F5RHV1_METUF|nr:HlyD family type I secretion periplasmic adaptor subunit [Methyloversatilis universalis]EGK69933.1 Putative proteases secretion protein prtE [Methyloversatilis universalis FAM5]